MRIRIHGASPGSWWLALRLDDLGFGVTFVEPAHLPLGPRLAPLPIGWLRRLARYSRLTTDEFGERLAIWQARELKVDGAAPRAFLESRKIEIDETALREFLRAEWHSRELSAPVAQERFDARHAARDADGALVLHNARALRLRDPTTGADSDRHDRVATQVVALPQLALAPGRLELHFSADHGTVSLEPARNGALLYLEARTRSRLAGLVRELTSPWPRDRAADPVARELAQRVRPHLIQTLARGPAAVEIVNSAPAALDGAGVIAWGASIGRLPPLFNPDLELELRHADQIVSWLEAHRDRGPGEVERLKLQIQLRRVFFDMNRAQRLGRFAISDPLLGRMFRGALSLTPGVTRNWLGLPC